MKDKIDFIADLLKSTKINASQKERLFALATDEIRNIGNSDEIIFAEIAELKKKMEGISVMGNNDKKKSSNVYLSHDPIFIRDLLKEFGTNTAFKFSTHAWDKTDFMETIGSFLGKLNNEKKDKLFSNLFNNNRHLYNLMNYFLFKPSVEFEKDKITPKFGWRTSNGQMIKIGWQYPDNLLQKWCEENYDAKEGSAKKFPFEYKIPEVLKPSKKINGKEIIFFEDVVNVFKNEIRFRGEENNFRNTIEFLLLKKHHLKSDNLNVLNNLDFYTYTQGVINAIDSIFEKFSKMSEAGKNIHFDVITNAESVTIKITHLQSYPAKQISFNEPNTFFSGDSIGIINHIFSLCDYSVISKFNEDDYYEIKILQQEQDTQAIADGNNIKEITSKFQVISIQPQEVKGFTHQFKFYL
jgi:hypothetical protein